MEQKNHKRDTGLIRLRVRDLSITNQHYIGTYFIIQDIQSAIDEYAKGNVLDIGCGNKPYQHLFNGKMKTYTGCDIIQSSENVVDYICPADKLCFNDNVFDTVFSTQVLEHVANHQEVIKESYRVLKEGGYAIFTMPFSWELHEEPYDFFRFSKYGLEYLFKQNGFEIINIKANGGKWAATFQLFLNTLFSVRRFNSLRGLLIKWVFIRFKFIILYNKFGIWLDKKYFDDIFTLNYLVIAKKINNG